MYIVLIIICKNSNKIVVVTEPGLFYWPNDELHGLSLWQSEGPAED